MFLRPLAKRIASDSLLAPPMAMPPLPWLALRPSREPRISSWRAGLRVQQVLDVHNAEGDVAALVLGGEAKDLLLGLVVGDQLAHAKHGLDGALAAYVQGGGHLDHVGIVEDSHGSFLPSGAGTEWNRPNSRLDGSTKSYS